MTEGERDLARRSLYPSGSVRGLLGKIIVLLGLPTLGMLLSVIPGIIFERFGMTGLIKPAILVCTLLGLIVGVYVLRRERVRVKQTQVLVERELEKQVVKVLHCTADNAIEVEEFEDEGVGFFLDLGNGQLLFLQGQDLYEPVEEGKFPNREFDLVLTADSKTVLSVLCKGAPLTPLRKRKYMTRQEYELLGWDRGPEPYRVFPGRLETLEFDIQKLKETRSRSS